MACALGHLGKSIGTVSSKLVNLGAVGNLIEISGGSGKGEIILPALDGNGTEVLWGLIPGSFLLVCYPLSAQAELVFSLSY